MSCVPVILCGGSGTRLWPLSRRSYPKQFIDLGEGRTLFLETLQRAKLVNTMSLSDDNKSHTAAQETVKPIIVCNEDYRFYVSGQLYADQTRADIILEPAPRNTAPALALAAFALLEQHKEAVMLVLPSDHMIADNAAFARSVAAAVCAAEQDFIVTFGVVPTSPETGYGYIKQGVALELKKTSEQLAFVEKFIEKPPLQEAERMLAQSGYLWNSGMFVVKASVYLEELRRFAPAMYTTCQQAWQKHSTDGCFLRPETALFLQAESNSIDYTVMEKTNKAVVCALESAWNDLGSWQAFYQTGAMDAEGNVCDGDVLVEDVQDCYIKATNRLVAAIGVQDLIIVETKDALLVSKRDRDQDVKKIVEQLKAQGRSESDVSHLVYRPWGSYETLVLDQRFQVKRIIVNPGQELSLQMHHHRAEHWVIVSGTAEVTNGEDVRLFTENQSTYIPIGTLHRLKNPGVIPLVLIEIQSGAYLGEDDIVRFKDDYGRS